MWMKMKRRVRMVRSSRCSGGWCGGLCGVVVGGCGWVEDGGEVSSWSLRIGV